MVTVHFSLDKWQFTKKPYIILFQRFFYPFYKATKEFLSKIFKSHLVSLKNTLCSSLNNLQTWSTYFINYAFIERTVCLLSLVYLQERWPVSACVSRCGYLEKEHEPGISWSQKKPAGEQAQGLRNSRGSQTETAPRETFPEPTSVVGADNPLELRLSHRDI